MDNNLGRNMPETRKNIVENNTLSYNNILALIDALNYGTATPMISLITTLRMMYSRIKMGQKIYYMDKNGLKNYICTDNFEEFILSTFDEFVLKEIYSDDKNGLYE